MPSVASDPSSIFPPPPSRGSPSSRAANDSERADTPFSQLVDQSAAPERRADPKPEDTAQPPRRARAGDNAPAKPAKAAKSDPPAKNAAAKNSTSNDKTPDAAKADNSSNAAACAPSQPASTATAPDQIVQDFEAAVAAAQPQDAADATATDTGAKPAGDKADATDKKDATMPDTKAADAAAVTPDATVAQAKTADAVAVAVATVAEVQAAPAPKTSVPQIPRVAISGDAKHAVKAQAQADTAGKPADVDDAEDTGDVTAAKATKGNADTGDAPVVDHVVRRAERFSAALDADTRAHIDALPAAKTADATTQPALPQAQAVQATSASAPVSAANAALSAKAVPLDGVAVEIAAHASEGKNRFEIRLDPPELGRIEVRLDIDKSGQVVSHISADRGDTLDLLRRDSANLERALQDAGLKTGSNNLQFSLRDQGFAGKQQETGAETARLVVNDVSTPVPTPRDYRAFGARTGGVDIRV